MSEHQKSENQKSEDQASENQQGSEETTPVEPASKINVDFEWDLTAPDELATSRVRPPGGEVEPPPPDIDDDEDWFP